MQIKELARATGVDIETIRGLLVFSAISDGTKS